MLVYALTWILCDVSLVELQLSGSALATCFLVVVMICLFSLAGQVLRLGMPPLRSLVLTSCIGGFACWQASDLPVSVPAETLEGEWIGKWEGLPNRSSSLFRPYFKSDERADDVTPQMDCSGEPQAYRIWVRGIKAQHHQEEAVFPGLCVRLQLVLDDSGKDLPPGLESWRKRNRIQASMRIEKATSIDVLTTATDPVDTLRLDIRGTFSDHDENESRHRFSYLKKMPVLLALVTGDRALMKPSHWQLFADTGTSHLMAISGTHVSMFAMLVFWVVRRLASLSVVLTRIVPAQHFAAVAGFCGALAYGLLAGFNVPTQRTLVMIAVGIVLKLQGRTLLSWNAWWIALVAVTLYDPLAIIDRGAWLSFFAVALILWVLQGRLRPMGVVSGWLAVQMAIFVGLAPLLAYAFGGFPLISPLANALAIPLTCFLVVPGALLYAALAPVAPLIAELLLEPLLSVTDLLFWFLQWSATAGGAGYRVPPVGAAVTLLGLAGALWCMAPAGFPGKRVGMAMLFPVLLGPGFYSRESNGEFWMPTLRQSVVLEDAQAVWWIFETGNSSMQRQPVFAALLRETGYGYAWAFRDERYSDWIKSGFLVQRYPKRTSVPGQILLGNPQLFLPCDQTRPPLEISQRQLLALVPSERQCWLKVSSEDGALLLAGDFKRSTQLAMSSLPTDGAILTLLLTPRAQQPITGAVLEHFSPRQIVEWPAKSSAFPGAQSRLDARRIARVSYEGFVKQRTANRLEPD